MQKNNLGLLFNEFYYKSEDKLSYNQEMINAAITDQSLSDQSKKLIERRNKHISNFTINKVEDDSLMPWTHTLKMKTTYPGLVIGIGLPHSIGFDGEFKTGFQFDYTTGLPYLPGSSVKGTIRDFLDQINEDNLKSFNSHFALDLTLDQLIDFRNIFFNEKTEGNSFVFFDAEIIDGDENNEIMIEDYLAPHSDIIKNPVPIKFLKIKPNVIIEFRFFLKDLDFVTAEEQLKMINEMLLIYGVGAKTNVGYGYFDRDYSIDYLKSYIEKKEEEKNKSKIKSIYSDYMSADILDRIKTMFPTGDDLKDSYLNYINGNLEIYELECELKEFMEYFTDEQIEEINKTLIFSTLDKNEKKIVFEYIEEVMGELDNWKKHKIKDQATLEKKKSKNKEIKRYLKFRVIKEKMSH